MPQYAFVFPGQGSQAVGMAQPLAAAFPAAREVLQEVDDALEQNLSRLMAEGPIETLTLTENAQPALMAAAIATLRVLEREAGLTLASRAIATAGHSLGEYTALVAAGALELAQAARLLRRRGQAMQAAVPPGEGAMAALLGIELPAATELCAEAAEGQIVAPANDNGGGQVVISGHAAAIDRAIEAARARGIKRAIKLPVSAPFHCALMAPAADAMREALAGAPIAAPAVPVIANVTARETRDPEAIRDLLVAQVTGLVRWRESMLAAAALGADTFVELGTGRVLTGLARRILPDATALAAGTPEEIDVLVKAF